jgi:hypothetical protein
MVMTVPETMLGFMTNHRRHSDTTLGVLFFGKKRRRQNEK